MWLLLKSGNDFMSFITFISKPCPHGAIHINGNEQVFYFRSPKLTKSFFASQQKKQKMIMSSLRWNLTSRDELPFSTLVSSEFLSKPSTSTSESSDSALTELNSKTLKHSQSHWNCILATYKREMQMAKDLYDLRSQSTKLQRHSFCHFY